MNHHSAGGPMRSHQGHRMHPYICDITASKERKRSLSIYFKLKGALVLELPRMGAHGFEMPNMGL